MLINHILSKIVFDKPFFVIGIDGPTAVGKTWLADNLADELTRQNIPNFTYRLDWTLKNRSLREDEISRFIKSNSAFEYEADLHMELDRASTFLNEFILSQKSLQSFQLKGLYNREEGGVCNRTVEFVPKNNMVLIIEGHYTHHKKISNFIDLNLLLIAEPDVLLHRKILRAGQYRNSQLVEEYFRHVDMPSFTHYLSLNAGKCLNIIDNSDFDNPFWTNKKSIFDFIRFRDLNYKFDKQNIIKEVYSFSDLRDIRSEHAFSRTVSSLCEFDFEASKLIGISESVRNVTFSELLVKIFVKQTNIPTYSEFNKLYFNSMEYSIFVEADNLRILFYSTPYNARIVVITDFTVKVFETKRVFAEFNHRINPEDFYQVNCFNKSEYTRKLIVPDKLFVDERDVEKSVSAIFQGHVSTAAYFHHFIFSEFEFLRKCETSDEQKLWAEIFRKLGLKPIFKDLYLYVKSLEITNPFINLDSFSEEIVSASIVTKDIDYRAIAACGLRYVDGVISGFISEASSFISLYKLASSNLRKDLLIWLSRHYSEVEVFTGLSLNRLLRNLPSSLNDYYFALSIRKASSIPFFTVYDLRPSSIDINAYFAISSDYKTPIGIQSSQNALNKESGYLQKDSPGDFAKNINSILVNFLIKNPTKNIPLWSLAIDHASSKLNISENSTKDFIKNAFINGFVTSLCLDIESVMLNSEDKFADCKVLINEWLSVIPKYVDIELTTGEGVNSLSVDDYFNNSEILYNSLIKAGFDKTSFVMGPALGAIHHVKSNNIRPDLSHYIYNLTSKNGNLGNVLHGTSFVANDSIAKCVENNCIRVNFAGQYLNCIVESLSEDLRQVFGSTQSERKISFSKNKKLFDSLSAAEVANVKESIKGLFNLHSNALNNIILDDQSADFFYNPVPDLPDDLIQTIGRKIFRIEDTRRAKRRIKPILLASMIEVPDGEFKAGIAKKVYNAGIKNFHIDVGDGVFINRKICGLEKIEYLKKLDPSISVHVHLMAISPHLRTIDGSSLIEKYCGVGASVIYLSPESFDSVEQLSIAINLVSQNNSIPGLVFNPDSEYSDEKFEFLQKNNIHNIQLMGVFSGRGGQRFIPGVLNTVTKYRLVADEKKYSLKIEVDGGLTKEIAKLCGSAGVDFLAGWSMFLSKGVDKITNTTKELLDEI